MKKQPLLSIITINYNNKIGLKRTFNSVINQTYNNYEYIVIDGDSSDGSKNLINENKNKIHYSLSEPDSGIYNAMNKGIKNARGTYLLFLNSGDELCNEEILEKIHKEIHTDDLIYFNLIQIFKDKENEIDFPEKLNYYNLIQGTIGHPSTFIKKDIFQKIGLYDESLKLVSDWKFFILAILKYKCTYRKVNIPLSKFFMDGLSSNNKKLVRYERKNVLEKYFANFYKKYKKEKRKKRLYKFINISIHFNNLSKSIKLLYLKIKYHVLIKSSSTIKKQIENPKTIPIVIISFNQLFYLKKLINFLTKRNFSNIVIIDNNSTYPPLLEYFDIISNESNIKIHRLNKNVGHLVFWKEKQIFKKYSKGYYVITDADIVPNESTPDDFMEKFLNLLNKNIHISKVGFNLCIDDIPNTNPNKKYLVFWEKQFWKNKVNDYYIAYIDTTFALYRPRFKRKKARKFLEAFRLDKPYSAIHGGWYLNPQKLTEEQEYYISTASKSSTGWATDKNNIIINNLYKNYYNKNFLNNNKN